jgi:hypothetical protein
MTFGMPVASAPVSDLLVPPARLASSLIASRTKQDLTLSDMELRAGGAFSLGELTQIEAGQLALRDPDLRILAGVYGIDLATVAPGRACLIIDRQEGRVALGDSVGNFKPEDDDRKIMLRYLALVYRIRNAQPGTPIPSRDDDLAVLADVFGTTSEQVRTELEKLMLRAAPEIRFQFGTFRNRLVVPALGILVALTAAGGLLLTSNNPVTAAAKKTNIGTAVSIERTAVGQTNIGDAVSVERPAVGHTNIGEALVIEN